MRTYKEKQEIVEAGATTVKQLHRILGILLEYGDFELVEIDEDGAWTPIKLWPNVQPFKDGQLCEDLSVDEDDETITYRVII